MKNALFALSILTILTNSFPGADARTSRTRSNRTTTTGTNSQSSSVSKNARDLPVSNAVNNWLKRHELRNSQVAVEVMDFNTGNVVCSADGERRFTPASTAKVFATSCAFELLGGNYRYTTAIASSAPIKDGKLKGDLYLIPSQDPTLTYSQLSNLFAELVRKGVKHVDGSLKLAPVPKGGDHFVPGFLNEDWGQEWMPVSSDLVVDKNIYGGGILPNNGKLIEMDSTQELSSQSRSIMRQDLYPGWMTYDERTNVVRAYRGYPSANGKGPLVVGNPTAFNMALANSAAKNAGLSIGRKRGNDSDNKEAAGTVAGEAGAMTILAEHKSDALSKIIQTCLHESDNLYAQQLLRSVGALDSDKGSVHPTLEERGVSRMKGWLASFGVPTQEVVLKDGCGLSRKDCVTPHSLNIVLRHMLSRFGDGGYVSLLKGGEVKNGGRSGTWKFKTGAMDSVRTITGVLKNSGGQTLLVTIMVNGHAPGVGDVRTSIGALVATLSGTPLQAPPSQPKAATTTITTTTTKK